MTQVHDVILSTYDAKVRAYGEHGWIDNPDWLFYEGLDGMMRVSRTEQGKAKKG